LFLDHNFEPETLKS